MSINRDEDYFDQFDLLNRLIVEESGTNSRKAETKQLLETMSNIITNPQRNPKSKFYSIFVSE